MLIPSEWVCVCSRTLWVSAGSCSVRLGVSPAATSNPTAVFNLRCETLFPCTGALGCLVCLPPQLSLPVYLHVTVGPSTPSANAWCGPPAAALPTPVCQPPPRSESSLPNWVSPPLLPVCMNVFFNSLVVRLPYNSTFCQSWLFLNCCCPSFGCVRKHSVSTYTSILAGRHPSLFLKINWNWRNKKFSLRG